MLSWIKLTCLKYLTAAKVMLKLAIPVMQALSLQDVAGCYHHWQPNAGFYFPPPNLYLFFFSPYLSPEGYSILSGSSAFLDNVLT